MANRASHDSPIGRRILWAGFLALGLLYPATRLTVVLVGSIARVRQDFADDAYYYALIAHNIAEGNGSTFGGIVPTNGYQPLWQLLLVPIATVSSGDAQVRLTFALAAIGFASFVVLAWSFSDRLSARREGLYSTVYAVTVGAVFGNQFFSGMEYALVVPAAMLVLLLLLAAPQNLDQGPWRSTRYGILLGLAVLLLALSRLDAIALPVVYALIILPREQDRQVWRAWIVAALVAAAGLITYAGYNLANYGTPVPVSGLAKALGGGTRESGVSLLRTYLEFGGIGPVTAMWLGFQATVLSVVALWLLRRGRIAEHQLFSAGHDVALSHIIQALGLGQLIQLGYYAATSSWHLWEWYFYYIPLQFMVAGVVVVRAAFRASWSRVLRRPLVAGSLAILAVTAGLGLFIRDNPATGWTTSSVAVGDWIERNTPSDAVIAMGDRAGGILWSSNRRAVQLEGLVEDTKYLSVLRSHTIPQHMIEQSVDYYVRGSTAGDTAGSGPVRGRAGCWSFTEPGQGQGPKSSVVVCDEDLLYSSTQEDGSLWQIWMFRPEIQGS
jgi:hypothetical protein